MRGRYKIKEPNKRSNEPDVCAQRETAADSPVPGLTVQDVRGRKKGRGGGARCSIYDAEKVYLGVRVRMPVRDILRNIRLARSCDGQDFEETNGEAATGDAKRVRTRRACRTSRKKHPTKSLEELAIIVEVLEEDLKTCNTYFSPSQSLSSSFYPPVSPASSPSGADYNSDDFDEIIPSPPSYVTFSPDALECRQTPSPPSFMHAGLQPSSFSNPGGERQECFDPQSHDWKLNSSAFFWTQLQKQEAYLSSISDAVLLATDEYGRTALHTCACVGRRALGYAIAKRMAKLSSLDLKDSEGMTALLYAAKHNHHHLVADLIQLGANVNETNHSGKSCLHLSAEKGYFRVLEVVKHTMMDGVYVDVEATDNSGMSVFQCASLALKAAVRELESSDSSGHARLHALHQEQMMETLECLLQMGSYLHTVGSRGVGPTLS